MGEAFKLFTSSLSVLYNLLTTNLIDYSRKEHIYAYLILQTFKAIGTGIVVILTYTSFIRQSSIIIERHPESIIKVLLRAVIVSFLVVNCTTYFGDVFVNGLTMLAKTAFNSVGIYGNNFADLLSNIYVPTENITDKITLSDTISEFFKTAILEVFAIGAKIYYICTMLKVSVDVIVTVFLRFIKIYMYTCTMPVGISFFADSNFSQYGKNWARTYVGALLEGVTIAIAIVMFCGVVQSNIISTALGIFGETEAFRYLVYVGLLKTLLKTISEVDSITNKLFGFA